MPAEIIRLRPVRPCPVCGKPSTQAHSPFCSSRCQDIDLNRWLSGSYRIPTEETPDDDSAESPRDGQED